MSGSISQALSKRTTASPSVSVCWESICARLSDSDDEALKGEDRKEAEQNSEAARLWITGLEMVNRKLGLLRVMDLSATPFFLSGSGYAEGTLFPWTMCDFSLMDAIECGIVKLPRVPVADNIPGEEMPRFRNLWENIRSRMPKKGRGKSAFLPVELQTALQALYGHYEKTYKLWEAAKIKVPPCFIVVCNNTSTSKLVYDYISGFQRPNDDGTTSLQNGALPLFRNFNEHGDPLARPYTLLIDSEQLESGEALDDQFRKAAGDEIERFRREIVERTGNQQEAENLTDQDLLREVMNTVGKEDRLGEQIRCVVSVSMLTEGWDAKLDETCPEPQRLEDALTSSVFGTLLWLAAWDVLARWLGIPFEFSPGERKPECWFWPRMASAEPDVVLRLGDSLVVVEAKYRSGRHDLVPSDENDADHGDQIWRQYDSVTKPVSDRLRYPESLERAIRDCKLIQVFVVDSRRLRSARREWAQSKGRLPAEAVLHLVTWQSLFRILDSEDWSAHRWCSDLRAYLQRTGLDTFSGFSLPSTLNLQPILGWRPGAETAQSHFGMTVNVHASQCAVLMNWNARRDRAGTQLLHSFKSGILDGSAPSAILAWRVPEQALHNKRGRP